jgi:hypothetical protein
VRQPILSLFSRVHRILDDRYHLIDHAVNDLKVVRFATLSLALVQSQQETPRALPLYFHINANNSRQCKSGRGTASVIHRICPRLSVCQIFLALPKSSGLNFIESQNLMSDMAK